jgi:outer membrane protein assembly factor BamB
VYSGSHETNHMRKETRIRIKPGITSGNGAARRLAVILLIALHALVELPTGAAEQPAGPVMMSNLWSIDIKGRSDSTPAIAENGTVYFGTFAGRLWAVAPDGSRKWVFDTGKVARSNMEIRSSPAVAEDGTVYFGCRDNRLYALSPEGTLKWTFETGAWVDSSPAVGTEGTIYFGSWDKKFYAVTRDGTKKWEFGTGGEIVSSAAIALDGTVYFGSHDRKFYALKPNGAKAWDYDAGGQIISSPAIDAEGRIYVTSVNGFFHALNPDGSLRWKLRTGGITESSPVVGEAGTVYVGVNNKIWAISPDGTKEWEHLVIGGDIQELVQATPIALAENSLYVLSRYGMLYRWDAARKPQERFYLYGSGYASPALDTNGIVYVPGTWTNFHALAGSALPAAGSWPMRGGGQANRGRAK